MVSTVTAAKEELNIAPHGLEDLLAVSCRERRHHRKTLHLPASAVVPCKVPHIAAYDTGSMLPYLLLPL